MQRTSSPPGDLPSKLTLAEVAGYLRSHPRTITRMYRAGKFPAPARVGPRMLWDRDEVTSWLAAQREAVHVA